MTITACFLGNVWGVTFVCERKKRGGREIGNATKKRTIR
jgi:hypothetical protein